MKKLLALVLALVMTMSLVTISNAAFKDADKIDNTEAVEVMAAVGVLKGYTDGSFGAKDTLTRGQAAKIVAYLDLGGKTADAIKGSGAVFTDVKATDWFAGYVEYCAGAGYVAGIGGGKFAPDEKVTGLQFAKMLLCVLGYSASIESMTGADWSISVAKLAAKNDLFDSVSGSTTVALTREKAAQVAFNALQATMVEYDNAGTTVKGDGFEVITGASKAAPVVPAKDNTNNDKVKYNNVNDHEQQLCEKLYGDKLVFNTAVSADDFGRPANQWKYDGKKVGTYTSKTPVLTYTDEVKAKALFSDLGVDGMTTPAGKAVALTVYANGSNNESSTYAVKNDTNVLAFTGKGVTTEVYKTDNANEYTVVTYNEYLAKVSSVTKADKANDVKRALNLMVYGVPGSKSYETESFAKGDYVLVTVANGDIKSVKAATVLENVAISSYVVNKSITADGTKHSYSASFTATIGFAQNKNDYTLSAGNTYTLYLDSNGNILAVEAYSATNTNYVQVLAVSASAQGEAGFEDRYVNVKYLAADGSTKTVKAFVTAAQASASPFVAPVTQNTIYTVAEDDDHDGMYKFTALPTTGADKNIQKTESIAANAKLDKTVATLGTTSFNNATVFVLKTDANTYKAVEGLSNMNTYQFGAGGGTAYIVSKNGVATVVFLDVTSAAAANAVSEFVYIVSATPSVSYDSSNKYSVYSYTAVVDGELTTVVAKNNTTFTAVGLYSVTQKTDGYVSGAREANLANDYTDVYAVSADVEVSFNKGVIKVADKSFVVASDVNIYMVDTNDKLTVSTDAAVLEGTAKAGEGAAKFWFVKTSSTDNTVKAIYFDGRIN